MYNTIRYSHRSAISCQRTTVPRAVRVRMRNVYKRHIYPNVHNLRLYMNIYTYIVYYIYIKYGFIIMCSAVYIIILFAYIYKRLGVKNRLIIVPLYIIYVFRYIMRCHCMVIFFFKYHYYCHRSLTYILCFGLRMHN